MPRWEIAGDTPDGSSTTVAVTVADDGRTVIDVQPSTPIALDTVGNDRLRAALAEARGTSAATPGTRP